MKIGWKLESRFQITIHEKDKSELEAVKKSLGGGKIYKRRSQTIVFDVNSQKELEVVINHFDKFPLITKKRADYLLFKRVFILIKNKEHLTP